MRLILQIRDAVGEEVPTAFGEADAVRAATPEVGIVVLPEAHRVDLVPASFAQGAIPAARAGLTHGSRR